MKRKDKFNFKTNKILFKFYFKKRFVSIRSLVCILLLIIPVIYLIIDHKDLIKPNYVPSQNLINNAYFWSDFIGRTFTIPALTSLTIIPIIMTLDIISGEFSNKTAMVLYSAVSRNKVIRAKIIYLIVSLFIFVMVLFLSVEVITIILFKSIVSLNFLIVGFVLIFINLLFYLSFTFILSALTRNAIISFLIPFVYLFLGGVLEFLDMKLFIYSYFGNNILEFFTDILIHQEVIVYILPDLRLSFIIFFGLPFFIFLITFYEFKKVDIRVI